MHVVTFLNLLMQINTLIGSMIDRATDPADVAVLRDYYESSLVGIRQADHADQEGRHNGDWSILAASFLLLMDKAAGVAVDAGLSAPDEPELIEAIQTIQIIERSMV